VADSLDEAKAAFRGPERRLGLVASASEPIGHLLGNGWNRGKPLSLLAASEVIE
jgi:hypothetical protein